MAVERALGQSGGGHRRRSTRHLLAQRTYYTTHNRVGYGTFDQLIADGELDRVSWASRPSRGLHLQDDGHAEVRGPAADVHGQRRPAKSDGFNATGKQFYYIDSSKDETHVNETQPAGPDDPPLGGSATETAK